MKFFCLYLRLFVCNSKSRISRGKYGIIHTRRIFWHNGTGLFMKLQGRIQRGGEPILAIFNLTLSPELAPLAPLTFFACIPKLPPPFKNPGSAAELRYSTI